MAAGSDPLSTLLQTLITSAPGLLGTGLQGLGAALQAANTDKAYNYLNGIGLNALGQNATSYGAAQDTLGSQRAGLSNLLSGANPWMNMLSGTAGSANNLLSGIPGLIGDTTNNMIYNDPNMSNQLQSITDLLSSSQGIQGIASQLLNSGGITNTQVPLGNFAQALMGGTTPNQQALSGAGNGILGSGGMTPELQSALDQASGIVSGGGATPLTDALAARGMNLASTNPLLSNAQAMSIAQDQTGRLFNNAAQTARAQAENRGQGPGAIVASGAGNRGIEDLADQALQAESGNVGQTLLNQQGLGLQQLAQGLNTGLSAADIQRTLELGGLGSVGNLVNASTGRLGTGGGLTMDASNLANSGGNFYNALLGLQQGNMAQGFNAGLGSIGQQQGLSQTALQDLMSGRTGQAGLGSTMANLLLSSVGQNAGIANSGLGTTLSALGQFGNQGGQWLGNAASNMGVYGGTGDAVANLMKQPNSWSVFLNNIGAGLQAQPGVSVNPSVNFNPGGGGGSSIPNLFNSGSPYDWSSLWGGGSDWPITPDPSTGSEGL